MGSPHQGVFGFPKCPGEDLQLCDYLRELLTYGAYENYVQHHISAAQVRSKNVPKTTNSFDNLVSFSIGMTHYISINI